MDNISSKLKSLIWIIATIENWPLWLKFRFGLSKNKEEIFNFRNGLKVLAADKGKELFPFKEIFAKREHSRQPRILDNYIVIDIGANIGAFSLFAATSAKNVKVYAYEPNPDTFSRLVRNIELNNLTESIKPFNLGVSEKDEERRLFLYPNRSIADSLYQEYVPNPKDFVKIKVVTLQSIFEDNKIEGCDVLKIDCEGAEYEILFNTPPDYLCKIKNIVLEYHQGVKGLEEFLERNGFSVVCLKPLSNLGMLYARRRNTLR